MCMHELEPKFLHHLPYLIVQVKGTIVFGGGSIGSIGAFMLYIILVTILHLSHFLIELVITTNFKQHFKIYYITRGMLNSYVQCISI